MNTIELFQFPDLKGASVCIQQDNDDLKFVGFLKRAQSLKVHGDPWFVFSETGYKGDFKCFKAGHYVSIPAFENKISSVRCVKGGLYNPKITLFEHVKYDGRSVTLERPTDSLKPYGFDNMASSHKEVSGAWILYTGDYYTGEQMVALAGDEMENYCDFGWNNRVNSLKPVQPYETY